MRAHTPHPRAPNPEQTARQKTCWVSHSHKVTEFRTSLAGPFGGAGPPNAGATPPVPKKSRPGPLEFPRTKRGLAGGRGVRWEGAAIAPTGHTI